MSTQVQAQNNQIAETGVKALSNFLNKDSIVSLFSIEWN